MRINFQRTNLNFLILLFISSLIFPNAVFAYAGPGVAIGAIIVFFSVIFIFFLSVFVHIRNFLIKVFKFIINKIKKLFNKKNKNKNKT